MSATQSSFGFLAWKLRSTRSLAGRRRGSRMVVRAPLRRLTPVRALSLISRSTRLRPTRTPSSASSAWTLGAPQVSLETAWTCAVRSNSFASAAALAEGGRDSHAETAAARHTHDPRHGFHRKDGLVRGHELEGLDDVTSFRANQAAAFERMSRSTLSWRFSLQRRWSSSRSAPVRPSLVVPPSIPARLTQPAMVTAQGSNSRAKLSTPRPLRASATT